MKHDFSDADTWTLRFDDPARKEWQKPQQIVDSLGLKPGMTVVDLGAGTGYFLAYLAAAVGESGQVLALDPEPGMVQFLEKRASKEGLGNVRPRVIPYDDPQLPDASVDRILIVDTWHHISDREAYSARLRQALKPGGEIYVVDFTKDSPEGPPPEFRLPPEAVISDLAGGGLKAETLELELPRQFVVRAHLKP
jgi:ubiquinone/menaquinone biosynthesis C-methylase UbiE